VAVRGFYPSLHLNLAADYEKLGRPGDARRELVRARERTGALKDDDYGRAILAAIGRLELRLATSPGAPPAAGPP
jgi:hypothetical protein